MEYILKAQEQVALLEQRLEQLERESKEKDALIAKLSSGTTSETEPIDATPEKFRQVFELINVAISKDHVLQSAIAAADIAVATPEAAAGNEDALTRIRIRAADKVVTDIVDKIWAQHGWVGADALKKAQEMIQAHGGDDEQTSQLEEAVMAFNEIEERNVVAAAIGEAGYRRQQQDKADFQAAMKDVQEALTVADPQARSKFVRDTQTMAETILRTKLQVAKSAAEMDAIVGTLSPTERQAMFRAQAISQFLGARGSSHSHNGQPCHGHSHQAAPAHTHSHDGKPCGGHSHSHGEDEEEEGDDLEEGEYVDDDEDDDHGHSHDDHGHSHDDHGHSHDDHGHSHDDHGHSHDDHGHSHHGHSHHGHSH